MYWFSERSQKNLDTCDPRIHEVFTEVIKHWDCTVIEGWRSTEKQKQYYFDGTTTLDGVTKMSRHQNLPSLAVDVMPYPIDWDDARGIRDFAHFVLGVAAVKGIKLEWGGYWKNFQDMPHYQLPRT